MSEDNPSFKLSDILVGHNEDVKDAIFLDANTIISCSRDATVRIWDIKSKDSSSTERAEAEAAPAPEPMETDTPQQHPMADPTPSAPAASTITSAASAWSDTINSNAQGFVNTLAFLKPDEDHPKGLIISAGQESLIDVRPPGYFGPDAQYLLIGHEANVCALDVFGTTIISGSWDKRAIVWKDWEKKYVLEGHTAAVWAVMAVSDTEFITGCADGKLRWYQGDKQIRAVQAHDQPVRAIRRHPKWGLVSCGNDGQIKTWTLDGNIVDTIYAHESYIYSLAVLPNGQIASCGEDRTLRIWQRSQCLQTISHPALSVWCVSTNEDGELVTGASDGVLRIWTRNPERQATEEVQKAYAEAVANTAIAEETTEGIDKESLPGMQALARPGKHDGEKIHINNNGNVEAYQWSNSERTWEQVGVVAAAASNRAKTSFEGKDYDYVFDVDFEEGKPAKKLPFNVTQNPWDAARIFLERNELPMTYLETTANFIVQNTKGTSIGPRATAAPQGPDPYGIENRYRPGDELQQSFPEPLPVPKPTKVLPWKNYQDLAAGNVETAAQKIADTNTKILQEGDKEKSLNDEDLQSLKSLVSFLKKPSAPTSASAKSSAAVLGGLDVLIKVVRDWDPAARAAAFDLLRILARFSPAVPLYSNDPAGILGVLDSAGAFAPGGPIAALVFGTRTFVNMFFYTEGLDYAVKNKEEILGKVLKAAEGSANKLVNIAVDTLLMNYSIALAKSNAAEEEAVALLEVAVDRVGKAADPEVLYRALMTLGNLISTGKLAAGAAKDIYTAKGVVSKAVAKVDASKEKRIVDLGVEVELLLAAGK